MTDALDGVREDRGLMYVGCFSRLRSVAARSAGSGEMAIVSKKLDRYVQPFYRHMPDRNLTWQIITDP